MRTEKAFPVYVDAENDDGQHYLELTDSGLSLRDYLAAKAMQGYVSVKENDKYTTDKIAGWSYEMADAMLTAREKTS